MLTAIETWANRQGEKSEPVRLGFVAKGCYGILENFSKRGEKGCTQIQSYVYHQPALITDRHSSLSRKIDQKGSHNF